MKIVSLFVLALLFMASSAMAQNVPITQMQNGGVLRPTDAIHIARCNYAGCDYQVNTVGSLVGASVPLISSLGGTGYSSYNDGQLLIGNSSTSSLTSANLIAGSNIVIANGHGTITISSTAGIGSVTNVTCATANGVSCTVANQGTTPILTFTLGAITPSSVNGITISNSNTPTWTIGSSNGTPVVTASSPLVITTATGNITCPTCAVTGSSVSSFSAGTTGLTPNTPTTGAIVLGGVLAVANGGTNASSASITAFNNITGYGAIGATGNTSSSLVFSNSPVLVAPTLGVATVTSINGIVLSNSNTPTWTIGSASGTPVVTASSPLVITATGNITCPTCNVTSSNVISVSNSDGTLTISPTTGAVVASIALTHANTWSGQQTFVAPILGAATGTSLAIGGGSIGTDNLEVTGTTTHNGSVIVASGSVGIGTATPLGLLHTYRATGENSNYIQTGDTSVAALRFKNANPSEWRTGIAVTGSPSYGVRDVTNSKNSFTIEQSTPTNALYLAATGNIGIGTGTPLASLDISQKTDALILPSGTTGQRPATSINGMLRYNTTATAAIEGYINNAWTALGAGSGTVTNIATTSPITGGPITTTGTIACATCGVTGSPLSQFASTTSLQLAGVISDETGTGVAVFGTAPTFTTSITDPLVIGGTAAGSSLSLQSTSGVGTTDFIKFLVGNSGATEAMRVVDSGAIGIGTAIPNTGVILDLGSNTTTANSTILLPVGTTGSRPAVGINGMLRYNSTGGIVSVEAYQNNAWASLGGGGSVSITAASSNIVVSPSPITGTGTIDLAAAVSAVTSVTSPFFNATTVATGYEISGQNGLSFPTDSAAGSSVAIGSSALVHQPALASTAFSNTAIGYQSLASATLTTAAINNTAVGYQALNGNTGGNQNTGIGYKAVSTTGNGAANTGVGYLAMQSIAGGASNNVAVGAAALEFTSGNNNVAIGQSAGLGVVSTTTTQNSVYVGKSSGTAITTGSNNTFLGQSTGLIVTTGGSNTIIGQGVGSTVLTTGADDILIGVSSAITASAAAGSNEIHIGGTGGDFLKVTGTNTASTEAVTINGTVTLPNVTTGTNADFACFAAGGLLTLQTSACTISQRKLKENFSNISGAIVVHDLMNLKPTQFNFKQTNPKNNDPNFASTQYGFIAEDVALVNSKLSIYENDMKTPKSWRQESVIAELVKGFQIQQTELESLHGNFPFHKCFFNILVCAD